MFQSNEFSQLGCKASGGAARAPACVDCGVALLCDGEECARKGARKHKKECSSFSRLTSVIKNTEFPQPLADVVNSVFFLVRLRLASNSALQEMMRLSTTQDHSNEEEMLQIRIVGEIGSESNGSCRNSTKGLLEDAGVIASKRERLAFAAVSRIYHNAHQDRRYGRSLFPRISRINHSCLPNAFGHLHAPVG